MAASDSVPAGTNNCEPDSVLLRGGGEAADTVEATLPIDIKGRGQSQLDPGCGKKNCFALTKSPVWRPH